MYGEEPLWISTGDFVGQLVTRARIRVKCVNLDDRHILGRVLHDFWIIHRLGRLRGVVIDILYLDVDLYERGQGHDALVGGVDRQPVVGG